MSDAVWVSTALNDPRLMKSFTSDIWLRDKNAATEAGKLHYSGNPLGTKLRPREIYADYPDRKEKKQPDIFLAGGFMCVTAACALVLNDFDLGEGGLYPVRLLQHDRLTQVEGKYFFLDFGAQKQAFLPEQTPGARKPWEGVDIWFPPIAMKDDQVAVDRDNALQGPDLWLDARLHRCFFVSNRLCKALKAAKVDRLFSMRKCRLI